MIAAAALLLSAPLFAQEKNFIDQPYLEVNGRAEMEVAPDEIYVRITINEQDSKGKVTVLQQEKDMVRRLKDLGRICRATCSNARTFPLRRPTNWR